MALTKSRFVLAAECATKLYYKDNRERYVDRSLDDDYLQALAEGGFQVGALAQVMFEGGVLVAGGSLQDRLARTNELMQRDQVTIFEAVIQHGDLLAVVDVLSKDGKRADLLEVKAKSYDPHKDGDLRAARGREIRSGFVKYVRDVAFQTLVFRRAWPQLDVHPFLVFADKSQRASVDGLNGRFRIRRTAAGKSQVDIVPGTTSQSIGERLLYALPVDEQVDDLLAGTLAVGEALLPFEQAIDRLAQAHLRNERIWTPPGGSRCANCEFRADPDGELAVGFRECWSHAFGWTDADFAEPSVLDLSRFSRKDDLINVRRLKLRDLRADDVGNGDLPHAGGGMTATARRVLQVRFARGELKGDRFDARGFARERKRWTWPLNFIDFETCSAAIPFTRGRRPYEPVAFQFSRHLKHADGRVEHRSQFIDTAPGHFPNDAFVRALRDALADNPGTIFRWHAHENTVLRAIRDQLTTAAAPVADANDLVAFIDEITETTEGRRKRRGARNMVDLCDLAQRYYFHPATRGSSSLKKVLPALMSSSPFLRKRYGRPVYGVGCEIPSLNFDTPVAWWQQQDAQVLDPYELLPPLFEDLDLTQQQRLDWAGPDDLREGGAAMTAYARLQFEDVSDDVRERVQRALLKYCELDTLAMVMAVQAWEARL
jgi:hypothetical protein